MSSSPDTEDGHVFAGFLRSAAQDADAAQGLAAAYASLQTDLRARLIDAVVRDATQEGIDPATVLVSLLAVEDAPEIAWRIAKALSRCEPEALRARSAAQAVSVGDTLEGGAVLLRPLYGDFVEVAALAWRSGQVTHAYAPALCAAPEALARAQGALPSLAWGECSVDDAASLMRGVLEHHRGVHGVLPEGAQKVLERLQLA